MGKVKAEPTTLSKKGSRLFAIGIVVFILLMAVTILVPKWKIGDTKEKSLADLEQQYGETFDVTWSTIDDHPMSTKFQGTVQSDKTGYVYEFIAEDYKMDIEYDQVNKEMAINDAVEAVIKDSISVTTLDGESARIRVLLETKNAPVDEAMIEQLAADLKANQGLSTITFEVNEIVDRAFEAADEQMLIFQRSLIPADAFETYEPVVEKFEF